jgi:hypothetical protein
MATKKPVSPTIKGKVKLPGLTADFEGGFPGSLVDLLAFCNDRAQREKLLQALQAEHQRICTREDEWLAAQAAQPATTGAAA